jgi:acetoin utilization deacetylase AcuC-like enzyme
MIQDIGNTRFQEAKRASYDEVRPEHNTNGLRKGHYEYCSQVKLFHTAQYANEVRKMSETIRRLYEVQSGQKQSVYTRIDEDTGLMEESENAALFAIGNLP